MSAANTNCTSIVRERVGESSSVCSGPRGEGGVLNEWHQTSTEQSDVIDLDLIALPCESERPVTQKLKHKFLLERIAARQIHCQNQKRMCTYLQIIEREN